MDRRPVAAAAARWQGAHRTRCHGIRGRRFLRTAGRDPRRQIQIRPLRARRAAVVRSRSRSTRARQHGRRSGECCPGGGIHGKSPGALGHGRVRCRRARKPGTPLGRLPGAAQRRVLPLGLPAAAEGLGALHAQQHEPRQSPREQKVSARRMMADVLIPTLDHLKRAYAVTSAATQVTPLLESAALAKETGAARVFVKPESLQWAGSFKVRGAYWRLKRLSPDEAGKGVVAYSSGNFAQGLAAAGQALGIPVTIVMPIDAPAAKRDATAGYGARVVLTDHGDRAREDVAAAKAREIAETERLTLLHPFDDPEIVAGQAGAGLEALDQLAAKKAHADLVFCSVGGGGLIGGVSLAFHYLSPKTDIIAVEPEGCNR